MLDFLREQYRHCKPILDLGEEGLVIEAAGLSTLLPNREPDPGIVTPGSGAAGHIARAVSAFVTALAKHRHFERERDRDDG